MEWADNVLWYLLEGPKALYEFYLLTYAADLWAFGSLMLLTVVFLIVPVAAIIKFIYRKLRLFLRETKMPKEREVAEAITDAIDDLFLEGKLTKKERIFWNKRLGKALNIPDIVPQSQSVLKSNIKLRLGLDPSKPVKIKYNRPKPDADAIAREIEKALGIKHVKA